MKIQKRSIFKQKRYYLLIFLFLVWIWLYFGFRFRQSDNTLVRTLQKNAFNFQPKVTYSSTYKIRSVTLGTDSLPLLIFIHGAPSSLSFWNDFLTDSLLLLHYKMMAIDRPGYGYSNFGHPLLNLDEQSKAIAEVIEPYVLQNQKIYLLGSSYGGTICAKLNMDYSNWFKGVIFQSSSLAPHQEKTYWITYPTSHWMLRWAIPPLLTLADSEKLSHTNELKRMENDWHHFKAPCIFIHGTADDLIYPTNVDFAKEKLTNAKSITIKWVEGQGHSLSWTSKPLIINTILELRHLSTLENQLADRTSLEARTKN